MQAYSNLRVWLWINFISYRQGLFMILQSVVKLIKTITHITEIVEAVRNKLTISTKNRIAHSQCSLIVVQRNIILIHILVCATNTKEIYCSLVALAVNYLIYAQSALKLLKSFWVFAYVPENRSDKG